MTIVHETIEQRMPREGDLSRLDVIGAVLATLITLGPLAATAIFG